MMRVLPPTNQTCLATNQVAVGCEKLLQKVVSISNFCNKICTCCEGARNLIQLEVSIHATCNYLICCKTSLDLSGKTRNITFQLVL